MTEKVLPTIASTTVNSANSQLTVTFSEDVFNATGGSGNLEATDFVLSISGGAATIGAATPTSISRTSDSIWVLGFNTSGTATGSETIQVVPASSSSIYDGSDNAASTTQSNNTAALNDKAAPTLSAVSIVSDNSTLTTWATTGDVITLSITASENIQAPTVTFQSGGNNISVADTVAGSGTTWTAQYTANSGDTEGEVSFVISFSDTAGNAGTNVTAVTNSSLVLFDKTAPTLTSVSISANNSNNTLVSDASSGIVTLSIYANEEITQPTVVFKSNGAAITDSTISYSGSGRSWTAKYDANSSDGEGAVTFAVSFNNGAGISGTNVTAVTNSTSVTTDLTLPTLNTVGIVSNNSTNTVGVNGDEVTLTFTSSEEIRSGAHLAVAFTSGGVAVTDTSIRYDSSGNTHTAKYTVMAGDTGGAVGYTVTFKDRAENSGTPVTSGSGSVTIDRTAPSLNSVGIASNNSTTSLAKVGNEVTLTFTANESIETPSSTDVVFFSGGAPITNAGAITYNNTSGNTWTAKYTVHTSDTEGGVTFNLTVKDPSENSTTVSSVTDSSTVTFDKTVPTLSSVSIASNNTPGPTTHAKVGHEVILSFAASEAIKTNPTVVFKSGGVAITNSGAITYANPSGNNWTAKYTAHTSDTEGAITYSIDFDDLAGNDGTDVTSGIGSVTFDKTVPTLSSSSPSDGASGVATNNNIVLVFNESIRVGSGNIILYNSSDTAIDTFDVTSQVTVSGATVTLNPSDFSNTTGYYVQVASTAIVDKAGNAYSGISDKTTLNFTSGTTAGPTISSVGLVSSNSANNFAKHADVVTLTFTANKSINTPVVVFQSGGQAINDGSITYNNTSGNTWTAAYTANSSDVDGAISYQLAVTENGTSNLSSYTGGGVSFDNTVPTLDSIGIASNNGTSTSWATTGNEITLTFTANESIQTPSGTDVVFFSGGAPITNAGAITYNNTSGNTWTAKYTAHTNDTDGPVTFTIDFDDLAGNLGTQVTSVNNSSSVTYDETAPTLSGVSIASDNSPNNLANAGDIVTLTMTSNEPISQPTVTFQSGGAAINDGSVTYVNTSGNTWIASYTANTGDTEGNITFSVAFSNLAGISGVADTTVDDSSAVTFDKTAQALQVVSIASNNSPGPTTHAKVGHEVIISITANEVISRPTVSFESGGAAIANGGAITYANPSGNNWTAKYTAASGDIEGLITFSISYSDGAGMQVQVSLQLLMEPVLHLIRQSRHLAVLVLYQITIQALLRIPMTA